MLAGVAALSSVALAGEVTDVAPVTSAGADFLAGGADTVSVRFAGRTEFQFQDNDDDAEGFDFRRLRLGAKAKLGSGWASELIADFAPNANSGGSTTIRKAVITKQLNDMFHLSLGRDKVVFGYEETSSSATGVFLERSALNDTMRGAIGYGVANNITLSGDFGSGFSGAISIADSTTVDTDAAIYARVQWANDFLTVGLDYADNNDADAFTVYANYEQGGLNALVEYFDGEDTVGTEADGYSARVSYRFGDFEPVVRYSDYDTGTLSNDETFIGFNYYMAPQVTLLAGYADSDTGGVDGESLTARLRVLW